jgi:hypothetical protein
VQENGSADYHPELDADSHTEDFSESGDVQFGLPCLVKL